MHRVAAAPVGEEKEWAEDARFAAGRSHLYFHGAFFRPKHGALYANFVADEQAFAAQPA
jgi:hypothetical protein